LSPYDGTRTLWTSPLDLSTHETHDIQEDTMSAAPDHRPVQVGPPTKHQLAVMIWLAVFPTLTVLNLVFGDWLGGLAPVTRTFVLATVAVPIVIYGLMPQLHRARVAILTRALHA
jgi:antibiotic biosynthesis monooxygenase (ABM) superfamily enzyme